MVTKNAQPPNRVTITRGFYVIVTINSCYYYHYGISKDQQITLVFGEKIKCFFLKKNFFSSACKIINILLSPNLPCQEGHVGVWISHFIYCPKLLNKE